MSKTCAACGAELTIYDRVCDCGALTRADEIQALRTRARIGRMAKDPVMAAGALQRALQLVPEDHPEHALLAAELEALLHPPAPSSRDLQDENADSLGEGPDAYQRHKESKLPKWLAPLGVFGLFLWKVKGLLLLALTKGKLLLMGFTKWKTVLSMLLAFSAYWAIWGWAFAAGFVLSIYVHEMGHVWALRRHGLAATAPMFIPFVGAFVRLKEAPRNAIEDARIGLGGPWWGLGAALACLGLYHLTDAPIMAALARVGAYINLFNLIPVWQLDGGRAFAPLTRVQRVALLVLMLAGFAVARDGLFLFLVAGAGYRIFKNDHSPEMGPEGDVRGALAYAFVFVLLTALMLVRVPGISASGEPSSAPTSIPTLAAPLAP